ncbi:hypothetical protein F9C07_2865 [Aspergillus flavus]|uniref:Uncharacterized protein n=1 Tax=Aspergillus flavus (strain ATCC 200026 / FGSC A1120 / IAM 13836 / NRRL 3357 / JCM 12722 / SRRC 167) TaxID=332952 RepID=A0A7U2QS05_ASPFN|nr:hypothetical protein F9C07_2865 [Aspergillus flavus]GMG01064.1 unnamed protein product [Aspergillus oryzae]
MDPPAASETKDEDTQRIGVAKFVQDVIIHGKEERAMGPIVPVVGVTNVDLGILSNHAEAYYGVAGERIGG